VDRAKGSHKWDVDGNEYIDYWMGHGSLFLGHCHPAVVKAVQEQVARGTHLGASHELEVRWAELVQKLIPSAQMVRFTMSGTEATHLALRIARAFTGRPKILKFQGHFPRLARRRGGGGEPAVRRADVGGRPHRGARPGASVPAQ
jgi:glutamate-1-semialdehyde 2,1-aminomutase